MTHYIEVIVHCSRDCKDENYLVFFYHCREKKSKSFHTWMNLHWKCTGLTSHPRHQATISLQCFPSIVHHNLIMIHERGSPISYCPSLCGNEMWVKIRDICGEIHFLKSYFTPLAVSNHKHFCTVCIKNEKI